MIHWENVPCGFSIISSHSHAEQASEHEDQVLKDFSWAEAPFEIRSLS